MVKPVGKSCEKPKPNRSACWRAGVRYTSAVPALVAYLLLKSR
jgi:hypothetical protein